MKATKTIKLYDTKSNVQMTIPKAWAELHNFTQRATVELELSDDGVMIKTNNKKKQ